MKSIILLIAILLISIGIMMIILLVADEIERKSKNESSTKNETDTLPTTNEKSGTKK